MTVFELWDDDAFDALATRAVRLAREAGALSMLPVALVYRSGVHVFGGELAAASALIAGGGRDRRRHRHTPAHVRAAAARRVARRRGRGDAAASTPGCSTRPRAARARVVAMAGLRAPPCSTTAWAATTRPSTARQRSSDEDDDYGYAGASLAELVEAAVPVRPAGGRRRGARRGSRSARAPRARTGRSASWPARRRCWRGRAPTRSTARRSSGSGAPGSASSSPAPTCSTASGCGARTGAWTRASSCAPPTTRSPASAPRRFAERARRELAATGETVRRRTAGDARRPHAPGGADRPAGRRRADEPGDRRPAVHQPAHRRVPPAQGLHQARHRLPQGAARGAGDWAPRPRRLGTAAGLARTRSRPRVGGDSPHAHDHARRTATRGVPDLAPRATRARSPRPRGAAVAVRAANDRASCARSSPSA